MSSFGKKRREDEVSPSRRAFLRLRKNPEADLLRPPWTDAERVAARCTACKACEAACPENIIRPDSRGHPFISFDGRECSFCGKCAESCDAEVFDLARTPPWDRIAHIDDGCLQDSGVSCHLCRDFCPVSAIRVDLEKQPFGRLTIDAQACTGCGACLGACPQDVVAFSPGSTEQEVA
ncbi:ferredoxin-type protein NapF [Breoghania sp.]|uniref:ferredoxin-type protein NapF n=1 Tax=Breoghania sp. TaxID=2065378 RepID=UPI002AAC1677|nr:ferredoxin-type protein NapF [Breoghania sp.]